MLDQTEVILRAKRLIQLDATYESYFTSLYPDSLKEVEQVMGLDFDRYYNGVLSPTYIEVTEFADTTSLFKFNVNPRLKTFGKVVVNGTEYDDIMATVLSITKDGDYYLVELNIEFTADDTGSATVRYLDNYYQGHAYMLCYTMTTAFQKLHMNDVLITVKDFGDGSVSVNSQTEITNRQNFLKEKAKFYLGKSLLFEVI